jgi:hypothetical protein
MENKIEQKDEFLKKTKAKYEKLHEYGEKPKIKEVKVEGLLDDMNSFPGRIQMSGPIGSTSVLPDKVNANPLHGLNGKMMAGSELGKSGDNNKYKIEELEGDD